MTTIYYASYNQGDGSAGVRFFEDQECIDLLEEHDLEGFGQCEGGGSFEVNGSISGIEIETLDDVKEYLIDCGFVDEDEL